MVLANFGSANWIVGTILALLLFIFTDFILFRYVCHRYFFMAGMALIELVVLAANCFSDLEIVTNICLILLLLLVVAAIFANINDYRPYLSNTFAKNDANIFKKKKAKAEVIFDRDSLYKAVKKAVIDMSMIKQGCLITFEKNDDILDEARVPSIVKQRGVELNSPITPELLETIFYVGTPLHDGAVVIRDDKIARASVFFAPTNKPLTGKYGSRHQAALGISENTDSVTIVVSEETGRIGIASQGEITPVTRDNFMRVFEEAMKYDSKEENKE